MLVCFLVDLVWDFEKLFLDRGFFVDLIVQVFYVIALPYVSWFV